MARNVPSPSDKIRVAARRLKVMDYAKAGLSFRAIAERLTASGEPIGHAQVFKDYQHVMRKTVLATQASKAEMVALESERIDMVRVAQAANVVKGSIGAGRLWLDASESYRKLHGLDKPIQIEDVTPPRPKLDYSKLNVTELRLLEELLSRAVVEGETEGETEPDGDGENEGEDD